MGQKEIKELLHTTNHRSWPIPDKKWQYYQEWNDALLLHFEVEEVALRKLVPPELTMDRFEGKCYISIVVFRMQNIRPRNLPAVSFLSNFYEINMRTYIDNNDRKGVFFFEYRSGKMVFYLGCEAAFLAAVRKIAAKADKIILHQRKFQKKFQAFCGSVT